MLKYYRFYFFDNNLLVISFADCVQIYTVEATWFIYLLCSIK